ncbi:hypothetical protein BD408DRAFT_438556 [Parasitella parasitica]|nr:hypothetical protein BD408DRAFT_438556 [Parasitella parasitica]
MSSNINTNEINSKATYAEMASRPAGSRQSSNSTGSIDRELSEDALSDHDTIMTDSSEVDLNDDDHFELLNKKHQEELLQEIVKLHDLSE